MTDANKLPDITAGDEAQWNAIQKTIPDFERTEIKSTHLFGQKTPEQFSAVEKIASDLAKNGSNNLGYFSTLFLEAKAGRMSKQQILKALDLRFNAEYKYVACQLSLQLDEANKAIFFEYLKRDTAQRNALAEALRDAGEDIASSIFTAMEQAMKIRKKWQDSINRLYSNGLMTQQEAENRLALAVQEAKKLEQNAINMADILYASLWDKAQYALLVPIKELLERTSEK